jgi:hypothetical protein
MVNHRPRMVYTLWWPCYGLEQHAVVMCRMSRKENGQGTKRIMFDSFSFVLGAFAGICAVCIIVAVIKR